MKKKIEERKQNFRKQDERKANESEKTEEHVVPQKNRTHPVDTQLFPSMAAASKHADVLNARFTLDFGLSLTRM